MKKLIILAVLVAGAVYFLNSGLNDIVKTAIEDYGTQSVKTKVTVGSVDISLSSGKGAIYGLAIANPVGFSHSDAIRVGEIAVTVDTASVAGDGPVIINEVVIDSSQITYESDNDGNTNLKKIGNNTKSDDSASSDNDDGAEPDEVRKVVIENLYIRNGTIGISHPLLEGESLSTKLPTIHLKDIGKKKGGATPEEVSDIVVGAVTKQANRVATADLNQHIGSIAGMATDAVKSAKEGLDSLFGN